MRLQMNIEQQLAQSVAEAGIGLSTGEVEFTVDHRTISTPVRDAFTGYLKMELEQHSWTVQLHWYPCVAWVYKPFIESLIQDKANLICIE